MIQLGLRLLPYAMVLVGLLMLRTSVPILLHGGETAPTSVALNDLTVDSPDARWLSVTDGGLYLPDALIDTRTKRSSGTETIRAYYVPLISQADAIARAAALEDGRAVPPPTTVVLVRFEPREFRERYPQSVQLDSDELALEHLAPDDVFRPGPVVGLRGSEFSIGRRVKDHLRAELRFPIDHVVILRIGSTPMQRDRALAITAIMAVFTVLGALWIVKRFRKPAPAPPPPGPFDG